MDERDVSDVTAETAGSGAAPQIVQAVSPPPGRVGLAANC